MSITEDMTRKICAISKQLGAHFTLHGRPMTNQEVFVDTGLMPAIARRADQLCSLCLGYGLGLTFHEEKEGTILGLKLEFDAITPESLRLLCITDVVCELIHSAPSKDMTPLDELLYD